MLHVCDNPVCGLRGRLVAAANGYPRCEACGLPLYGLPGRAKLTSEQQEHIRDLCRDLAHERGKNLKVFAETAGCYGVAANGSFPLETVGRLCRYYQLDPNLFVEYSAAMQMTNLPRWN